MLYKKDIENEFDYIYKLNKLKFELWKLKTEINFKKFIDKYK